MSDSAETRLVKIIDAGRRQIAASMTERQRELRELHERDEALLELRALLTIHEESTPAVGKGSRPNMSAVRPSIGGLAQTVDGIFEKAKEGKS